MKRTRIDMHRASTPALDTGYHNAANSALVEASEKAMTMAQLRACPIPPIEGNPLLNYADPEGKIRNWIYNGAKPQSSEQIKALAIFCVRQNLPDALSWLVLQCDIDKLILSACGVGDAGWSIVRVLSLWTFHPTTAEMKAQ
jgi:hypothetical protein